MARLKKLNPNQISEIFDLFDDGYTTTQIQTHLLNKHNVSIAIKNIAVYLRDMKSARKDATDLAYANAAAKSAVRDIDIIDRKILQLDKLTDNLLEKKEYKFAKDFQDILLKYISKKIDLNQDKVSDLNNESNALLDDLIEKIKSK